MADVRIACLETPPVAPSLAGRKRLGLIALATDLTSETDLARLIPADRAGIHATRVAYENPTTPDSLRRMKPALTSAADLIVPGVRLDAICYSCTAASVVIGDTEVASAINKARPGVPVVTPTLAARQAFAALGIGRIAVLTPYTPETSAPMARYFTAHGLKIARFACFGMDDDREMAVIAPDAIRDVVLQLDGPDVQGFFISCTALPAIAVIGDLEKVSGKPVVTSNQASAWALMRHAGLNDTIEGYGALFGMDLPRGIAGTAA